MGLKCTRSASAHGRGYDMRPGRVFAELLRDNFPCQQRPPPSSAFASNLPSGHDTGASASSVKDKLHLSAHHHQLVRVAQLEYSPQKPTAPDENRQQAVQGERRGVHLDLTPGDNPTEHQAVHELEALLPRELQDDGDLHCEERQHDRHGVHDAEAQRLSHRRRERVQREHPVDPEPRRAHERASLVPGEKVHDAHMRRRDLQRQEDEVERRAEEDEQLALVAGEGRAAEAASQGESSDLQSPSKPTNQTTTRYYREQGES